MPLDKAVYLVTANSFIIAVINDNKLGKGLDLGLY